MIITKLDTILVPPGSGVPRTSVADTGKFGVGEFSQSTGQILIGSTYYYQGFGENGMGTSYSPVDSFVVDTTGAGGGTIYVDGRPVNEAR